VQQFLTLMVYLRRPRNMSNIPETSAIALPAEPTGISGVPTVAIA
jgi:hypothetical protein